MSGAVRVIIVEDLNGVRDALGVLIDSTPGFQFVAGYGRMEDALQDLEHVQPSLCLVDLGLPGMSGIDGIRALRNRSADMPVLALTVYDDDDRVFAALCAGASGYLLKNMPAERLLASLDEAMSGGAPMSPQVARRVVRLFREFRPPARAAYRLTPQELELLRLLVDGHHYKTAAHELGVSVNTVSFHLKNIYAKLQVHSKSEAVAKALRERLV